MTADALAIRTTRPQDFADIVELCHRVYPHSQAWTVEQLASHHQVFPAGQLVAVAEGRVVGMAASLIVRWDDYDFEGSWRDFTAHGYFTNHDPELGRTLYGAEVMVDPALQGRGVGSRLYDARRALVTATGLRRIRAGARLRGYHRVAETMTAERYVRAVEVGEIVDATLSFQLHRGFRVVGVVPGYLRNDPASLGWAAIIEWMNPSFEGARPGLPA